MNIISFFAGAGGLDRGFEDAGFNVVWANEYDKTIWDTYRYNHPNAILETKSIVNIEISDIPNVEIDGIIGGPPCQSWSLAGAMRGIDDERGKLFYEYLRILDKINPKFFMVENVPGMISKRHIENFLNIKKLFESCGENGYEVSYEVLTASDFGVAQDRKRVFLVGYRKDLNIRFDFNRLLKIKDKQTLKKCIGNLPEPLPALEKNKANENLDIPNHEYAIGGFSSMYMSRNRKKDWDQQSFTIQAGGRHAPLHPESTPMIKVGKDEWKFDENTHYPYRRLSVRECARIQSFPDDFKFIYTSVMDGYKMVGNAVPVELANTVSSQIRKDLESINLENSQSIEANNLELVALTTEETEYTIFDTYKFL